MVRIGFRVSGFRVWGNGPSRLGFRILFFFGFRAD